MYLHTYVYLYIYRTNLSFLNRITLLRTASPRTAATPCALLSKPRNHT